MAGATYSGIGSGGSEFNAGNGHFPAVPYGSGDFNPCTGVCSDNWCDINNYNDPVEVCASRRLCINTDLTHQRYQIIFF